MGRSAKPIELLMVEGKKHLTKEEIEERRNSEIRFGDEKLIPDLLQNHEIPYEKRTEIKKLFRVF